MKRRTAPKSRKRRTQNASAEQPLSYHMHYSTFCRNMQEALSVFLKNIQNRTKKKQRIFYNLGLVKPLYIVYNREKLERRRTSALGICTLPVRYAVAA